MERAGLERPQWARHIIGEETETVHNATPQPSRSKSMLACWQPRGQCDECNTCTVHAAPQRPECTTPLLAASHRLIGREGQLPSCFLNLKGLGLSKAAASIRASNQHHAHLLQLHLLQRAHRAPLLRFVRDTRLDALELEHIREHEALVAQSSLEHRHSGECSVSR